jgi:hypothetical protein
MKNLNKNKKCARCKSNHNFIMTKCEKINMKTIEQSYGARSYFKLILKILKIMEGLAFIYTLLGLSSRKFLWILSYVHHPKTFLKTFLKK